MKKIILLLIAFITINNTYSQINTVQNGLKTTVIGPFSADATQAKRFEIANVGYNSHHWQTGGIIIIELYNEFYGIGYEKYVVENGFLQGANSGVSSLKLIESSGIYHNGIINLAPPEDLETSYGDFKNKQLSIFLDVKYYSTYRVKITYLQQKVDTLTTFNQIKINQNPAGVNIADFTASTELNTNLFTTGGLRVSGEGNHYIINGNVGIGTTNPTSKLTVAGDINSREVRVTVNAGADFVFEKDYDLPSLDSVANYIKENKHLPEIASAEEMKKDGINLSEMNIKLLQKIEELTLYLIAKEKAINIQREIIKTQDKRLNDVEKNYNELKKNVVELKNNLK